jgi:hypothetical protein
MYFEPWLWYDGDQHGGFDYFSWEAMITSRMSEPSPVTIRFWGDYTPTDGSGTVYAQFRNDSTATINGFVILVITEDSVFYPAPNGNMWHSNIPRDYLPDHNGIPISIPAGDSVVVSQSFTIDAVWNDAMCEILTWVQDTVMQADSTYEIWQGGLVPVTQLSVEERVNRGIAAAIISAAPNPCYDHAAFSIALPVGSDYTITIFDISGRPVSYLHGTARQAYEQQVWDCTDVHGAHVASGIYFYQLASPSVTARGKVVVY